jgi:HEAT repeat protein
LRALEFLNALLSTKNKITKMQEQMLAQIEEEKRPPPQKELLSRPLRKNIISSMIYVIEQHSQSSIGN